MPKDTLHQLIHTLTSTEKRYYMKSKGDSHQTLLFGAMNKIDEYDDTLLEKKLNKHKEVLKHINKYKHDTLTDIIRTMRTHRQDKNESVNVRLKVYLMDIDFLIERGLYEYASKYIREAKKLAVKYEKYEVILELIQYERGLIKRLYSKDYIEMTDILIKEKNNIMSIINDESRYNDILYFLYSAWQRLPNSNDKLRRKYLDKLMDDELLLTEERAVSFISQYRFYQIHASYNTLINDIEKAYIYYKKVIDCWNDYPHQKFEYRLSYVWHIHNYLGTCIRLNNDIEFEKMLNKVKKEIIPQTPHEETIVLETLYRPELLYYLNKADFDKLGTFISTLQPKLDRYLDKMRTSSAQGFQINITMTLFFMGKYKKAFQGFDRIIKQKLRTRIDIQCCSWILKLAIAYEAEYDNFDNLYRAAQRFFKKISPKEINSFYPLCLQYLYKLNNAPLSETKQIFINFNTVLEELYKDKTQHTFGLNELTVWTEYIISKKPMTDIIRFHKNKK